MYPYMQVCAYKLFVTQRMQVRVHQTPFKWQRSFDLVCIAMETLVISCDVLNSFGQHCHERGRITEGVWEWAHSSLSFTADNRRRRRLKYLCTIFCLVFFYINAFESKRQDGLLESFCVRLCVCYVTVELRDNCNCCTLRSKFEIDHKKRFKCQHTCT